MLPARMPPPTTRLTRTKTPSRSLAIVLERETYRRLTLRGGERGFVVRMVGDLRNILHVLHFVLGVDHENRAAQDAQLFDKRAVGLAERRLAMVGKHFYVIESEGI